MTKTVMITGASAGVGRAVARRFAQDGASVGLIARNRPRLDAAVDEIRKAGGRGLACPTDVADADAVESAAEAVEREFGPIDVWINGAMATIFSPLAKIEPDEFRRATEVTYLGTVYGTMAALRRMTPRDSGVILQIGSALAYRSIPLQSPYCGAKHAIVGFTDSLRSELIHDGSKVELVIVHLPAVNTPQFEWARNKMPRRPQPVPPIYQPEVAADAIHFAAIHPRRELWLGWPTVKAVLGQKAAPGMLDHMLANEAYAGQQTDELAEPRDGNLYSTVDGDYGAHGRFDDRAQDHSSELWFAKHRPRFQMERLGGWISDRSPGPESAESEKQSRSERHT
jgi:NAD(P)-dependent dehydrogenase (short-subunit alcohol dehydrogenase family)